MDSVIYVHAWVEAADLEIVKRAKEPKMVVKGGIIMEGEWWNVGFECWSKNKEQEGSIDGFLFRPSNHSPQAPLSQLQPAQNAMKDHKDPRWN
jgi:hypothetical protein